MISRSGIVVALLALPLALQGTEYYADPANGDDANDGRTQAKAFKTLSRATRGLMAGDVLDLAPGAVFNESLVLRSSGEPGRPIVIRGNNAIIDGAHPIDRAKWESKGKDLWFQPSTACWGALRPRVYLGDRILTPVYTHPNKVNLERLEPKTAVWRPDGVYFRAEPGRNPSDYALVGGIGRNRSEHSGVIIENRSYITVENLVVQRFPNDGYNVHGRCCGLLFRNITARQNGDDGFSIHDDVTAVVEGIRSCENDYGVEDIGTAQTIVSGALIETNRLSGFSVYGGMRILRDATVRGNGGRQLSVRPSLEKGRMPTPLHAANVYFDHVRVEGGDEAMGIDACSTVTARSCTFVDSKKGFVLKGDRIHFDKCAAVNLGTGLSAAPSCRVTCVDCRGFATAPDAPGWSNVNPGRQLSERVGVVWEADFSKGTNGFSLVKCDGAEGEIFFEDGRLCVRKTNHRGYLRVNAASTFSKPVGTALKSFADAEASGADPNYSLAFPRLVDRRNRLTPCFELDAMGVFMWGGEKNGYLANTPPGQAARRFSHFKVNEKGGTELRPVLVIGGSPSVTRWHRWGVQDYKTAASAWKRTIAKYQSGLAGKTNLEDDVAFAQRLKADVHHTAKVVKRNGRVRLLVDGRDEVPVFYKNPGSWGQNWGDCNGRALAKEGVRIQCFDVCQIRDWTNGFYDVARDIRNVRERMRASPESLTILSVYLSTPKEYAERHPTEIWRQPDGSPCVGQEYHMYSQHYTSTNQTPYKPKNPGSVWPWTSCASKVYERDIKDNLTRLLEGLRREGLDKRIIGFHIGGWHDGQFSMYRSDYSIPAKAGFRDYLVEKYGHAPEKLEIPVPDRKPFYDPKTECLAYDWNVYQHLLPFRFQERIARHLKKTIAKDVICLHWCMDAYCDLMGGSFYFDEFFASDAMDGLVSQPSYIRRPPGYTVGNTVPIASFNRRGKLYVDELDLRAWGCVPLYVKEESMGGLGFAMDLPEWQAVNHKMAGRMIAQDQGYWYFDISGGFWNPDEIERDIGASVRTCAEVRRRPKMAWKPSAAFVADSKGFLWCNHVGAHKNPCGRGVIEGQAGLLAASGVPYDEFSYDDVVGDPAALAPYKVVVLAAFREMDTPRQKFLDGLVTAGKTVVLLAGTGGYRECVRPVGRSPEILAVDPTRQDEFMSRFQTQWMRYCLGSTKGDLAEEMRPMSFSFDEGAGTEVLARYADDGTPAVVRRGRVVVIGQTEGLTPQFFNRLVREAGGYAPVEKGLQVDMNGEFVSIVALENGHFDFKLPYPCRAINLKTGRCEEISGDVLPLDLTSGEVRWYGLSKGSSTERSNEDDFSFYISNHDQSPTHRVIHPIVGRTNFVYDAKGKLETIHGEAIAFLVKDSSNVTIRNLRLDWKRPCLTEATIVDFADGETIVTIDRKLFPVTFRDGRLWMTGPGWTNETRYCKLFDGRTREMLPRAKDISFDGTARELPDGRIALRHDFSKEGDGAKEGDVVVFRPTLRDFPAIVVYNSANVLLEDVIIHDAKGMGLIAQRSENVTWRGTKTAADKTSGSFPRSGSCASLHADASHFSNVKGCVTVENCWFEGMMDDAINVHSTCLAITNVVAANRIRCRYMHPQAIGFEVFRAGETLRFINGATLENGPEVRVTDVEVHDAREVTLTLSEPLPEGWGVGDAVENADYQCAATFRNNIVRCNRARGSLFTTPKPIVIESNLFDRVTGAAVLFSGDDYYWYESGACRDVIVRGNVFSNCFASAGGYSRGILSFYPVVRDVDAQKACYHGNVLIEGNSFFSFDAPLLFALSVENLTWRGNRIVCNDRYPGLEQPPFVFRHCRNVTVDGQKAPDDTPMATAGRVEAAFDDGWEFRKEPDSAWRAVRLPHDWAIESRFDPKGEPGAGRLPYAGTGWYRKTFVLPADAAGQCVFLDVGGAMTESDVYLNGVRVGGRTYGFSSYRVNLTVALWPPGRENLLEIRCHVPPKSARFYFGAGLYRSLKLVRTAPIHVGCDGVFVTTELRPDGSASVAAQVDVRGPLPFIRNSWTNSSVWGGKVQVVNRVLGENGLVIRRPRMWSPESPHLYTLETVVSYEGRETDRVLTRFGVRTLHFDPKRGFFLNGRHRQMRGVCLHHDLGSLGAAFDRGAFERQVKIMKGMGADAIRTSHNPPAREVLDVCDEMGMLVLDEAFDVWNRHKYPADYATHFADWYRRDLSDFIRRDRSHPCVVMWSIGNEIPGSLDRPQATEAASIGRELTRLCHRLDPTRLTTMGHCRSWAMTNGMARATDVFGANYLNADYGWYLAHGEGRHGLIATETCSAVSTRGENDLTTFRRHNCLPPVEFAAQAANPACYGEFVWTGFDYLGEPDPYAGKGARSSYYGIVDLCGFPKERYWTYRAHWRSENPGMPDPESAGPVVRLELTQERFRELAFVKVRAVDAAGATVTNFNGRMTFAVVGAGRLEGVGNGDPMDCDSLKGDSIRAFHGLAQTIVRGSEAELRVLSAFGEQILKIYAPTAAGVEISP